MDENSCLDGERGNVAGGCDVLCVGEHRRHHRPQRPDSSDRRLRLAGRAPARKNRPKAPTPARSRPRASSSKPRPVIPSGASPSSSSSTRRALCRRSKPRSAKSRRSRSTCRSGSASTPVRPDRCPLAVFEAGAESGCPPASKVGESQVTTSLLGVVTEPTAPLTQVPVYNVIPKEGEAARFGLELAGKEVFLEGDVAWDGDYHEGFTIHVPKTLPIGGLVLKNRLVFKGSSGDGTFITTPAPVSAKRSHGGPPGTSTRPGYSPHSWTEEGRSRETCFPQSAGPAFESPIPPGTSPKECATIPYSPGIEVNPNTPQTDSPAGATVEVDVPHMRPAPTTNRTAPTPGRQRSHCRSAWASTPPPPTACRPAPTPSSARGPGTRSPARRRRRSARSTIKSPPLPEGDLDRQRLRRAAAQPRSDLGRRVPDLRRRRVGPLRDLGAADRQRQRRPDRPAS